MRRFPQKKPSTTSTTKEKVSRTVTNQLLDWPEVLLLFKEQGSGILTIEVKRSASGYSVRQRFL